MPDSHFIYNLVINKQKQYSSSFWIPMLITFIFNFKVLISKFFLSIGIFPKAFFQRHFSKGIFPKAFSQRHFPKGFFPKTFSQRYFPKGIFPKAFSQRHFPKGIFPRAFSQRYFPKVFSQRHFSKCDLQVTVATWEVSLVEQMLEG